MPFSIPLTLDRFGSSSVRLGFSGLVVPGSRLGLSFVVRPLVPRWLGSNRGWVRMNNPCLDRVPVEAEYQLGHSLIMPTSNPVLLLFLSPIGHLLRSVSADFVFQTRRGFAFCHLAGLILPFVLFAPGPCPLIATFLLSGLTWALGPDCHSLRIRCGGTAPSALYHAVDSRYLAAAFLLLGLMWALGPDCHDLGSKCGETRGNVLPFFALVCLRRTRHLATTFLCLGLTWALGPDCHDLGTMCGVTSISVLVFVHSHRLLVVSGRLPFVNFYRAFRQFLSLSSTCQSHPYT